MNETRKAGITVGLLFLGPLVIVAWILIATWNQYPVRSEAEQSAIAADLHRARNAREAPGTTHTYDDGYSDWQDQKRDEQRARDQAAYRADQQLDERIRDAANAAANTAVENAMHGEKPGY